VVEVEEEDLEEGVGEEEEDVEVDSADVDVDVVVALESIDEECASVNNLMLKPLKHWATLWAL